MRHNRRIKRAKGGEYDYWQSYSDMMAALVLMFVLIMSLTLVQINEQKAQLNKLLGIKPEIIAALSSELGEFGVNIDENTGDIQFNSDILFDYNKTVLKPEGNEFLSKFMPKYLGIIMDEKYIPYIAEIIIEGHTDDVGSYMSNLKLSQDRALSVADYCIGDMNQFVWGDDVGKLRKMIAVNGKSFSNPIYKDEEKKIIDQDKSRRVEIKFRLKDDETIAELQRILGQ